MKVIAVLGNNSGRNAGDMAILGNLLQDISQVRSDVVFWVPTTNPNYLRRHFGAFRMKPIPLLPWYGAAKNFGLPLFYAMLKSDMILICDNILFDRKFFNPLFNNLASISMAAPLCKKAHIPIILYNASIGPIDHAVGAKALNRVVDASPLLISRDVETGHLLQRLGIRYPKIIVHADCALNTTPPPEERMNEIISKEGLLKNPKGTIGMNVNAYIDNWGMRGTFTRQDFSNVIAETVDRLIETLDVDVLYPVTQVMDLKVTRECVLASRYGNRIRIISNQDYTYEEIAALIQRLEIHAGLRTHTLIFAAAMNTPMVCIKSYPKSTGFMNTIQQSEWIIDFEDLTVENLYRIVLKAWEQREHTRRTLKPIVDVEKEKAKHSAQLINAFFQ